MQGVFNFKSFLEQCLIFLNFIIIEVKLKYHFFIEANAGLEDP